MNGKTHTVCVSDFWYVVLVKPLFIIVDESMSVCIFFIWLEDEVNGNSDPLTKILISFRYYFLSPNSVSSFKGQHETFYLS